MEVILHSDIEHDTIEINIVKRDSGKIYKATKVSIEWEEYSNKEYSKPIAILSMTDQFNMDSLTNALRICLTKILEIKRIKDS